jgi:hypothetical protein
MFAPPGCGRAGRLVSRGRRAASKSAPHGPAREEGAEYGFGVAPDKDKESARRTAVGDVGHSRFPLEQTGSAGGGRADAFPWGRKGSAADSCPTPNWRPTLSAPETWHPGTLGVRSCVSLFGRWARAGGKSANRIWLGRSRGPLPHVAHLGDGRCDRCRPLTPTELGIPLKKNGKPLAPRSKPKRLCDLCLRHGLPRARCPALGPRRPRTPFAACSLASSLSHCVCRRR